MGYSVKAETLRIGIGLLAVWAVASLLWNYWYIVVPVLAALGGMAVAARLRVKRR